MDLRRLIACVMAGALLTAAPWPSLAQQDPSVVSVFRRGVEVVRSRITITNRWRTVRSIKREEVEIKQNGVRQTITIFEEFELGPRRKCYEIGFESTIPAAVKVRTVEISVRGAKLKNQTYTIKDDSSAVSDRARVGGCRELQGP